MSGTSSTTRKTNLVSCTDDATEISIPRHGARTWERSQQQQWHENHHPKPAPVMAQCATTGACQRSGPDASGVNNSRRNSTINRNNSSSWLEAGRAAIGLQRKIGTAGQRLLMVTGSDFSRAPFHASPEVSRMFLRSLRALRLHAFAASAMSQCGYVRPQQQDYSNDGDM